MHKEVSYCRTVTQYSPVAKISNVHLHISSAIFAPGMNTSIALRNTWQVSDEISTGLLFCLIHWLTLKNCLVKINSNNIRMYLNSHSDHRLATIFPIVTIFNAPSFIHWYIKDRTNEIFVSYNLQKPLPPAHFVGIF